MILIKLCEKYIVRTKCSIFFFDESKPTKEKPIYTLAGYTVDEAVYRDLDDKMPRVIQAGLQDSWDALTLGFLSRPTNLKACKNPRAGIHHRQPLFSSFP